jgi:hypothetical protein
LTAIKIRKTREKKKRRSNRVRARDNEKDMVIQLEVEEVEKVVGTSFTTEEEHDEFMEEYEHRVKEKAQENSITDMKEADRRYGVEVVGEILQEYLQPAKAYEKVKKNQSPDIVIVDQL